MKQVAFNPYESSEDATPVSSWRWLMLFVITMLWALPLAAEELRGEVVSIADGDTLTVLDSGFQQHKIRLAGIDAPEKKQAYGNVSRQSLGDMCFRKQVRVTWTKLDRYGRIIGKVYCNNEDVGLKQIQKGVAWWYRQYAREQSPEDQERYARAEQRAQDTRQGLWAEAAPMPPWEWRRRK